MMVEGGGMYEHLGQRISASRDQRPIVLTGNGKRENDIILRAGE